MIIDYRSDTVTKPGKEMLEAMFTAQVGDDVFGEDPSINQLELISANMFGMESALFCPSGTMTNQIAIKCHVQPGDEVICEESSHVYQYEGGGIAFNSGASVRLLQGDRGRITSNQVLNAINPDDIHKAKTSLVCLENTSNRGGGSCYDFNDIENISKLCKEKNLGFHLDGARLFNALVAKKESPEQYGKAFDSISICLSKSLGCPVGSLLLGKNDFIRKARRVRKVFGGGMRQGGFIAAAGIYALENNINRLETDHLHASEIASFIEKCAFTKLLLPVETNIIIFELQEKNSAAAFVEKLKNHQILAYAITPERVRLVIHLDINSELVQKTIDILKLL